MSAVVFAWCGAVMGAGLLRLRAGWSPRHLRIITSQAPRVHLQRSALRAVAGGLTGAVVLAVTRWPALAVTAGAIGWWLPTGWAARGRSSRELAVVEAIATWAEQLRDTLSAASGLEHAVAATARLSHGPLDPALSRLVERLDTMPLSAAVGHFAAEVRHPSADFVAAALITATEHEARDVGALLGHLAASARDEARLRRRVWVGRARTRSAARLIMVVTVVVVAGVQFMNPGYMDAYADATGQLVLLGIIVTFASAFAMMERLSRVTLPERFTLRVRTPRRLA
jgi:tight adherence protein B